MIAAPNLTPAVSVVIPTYNRRASLLRLLNALSAQTYPAERLEVIVVDDGSTDGTPDVLRSLRPPYALSVVGQANTGPAAARNAGVAQAQGEVVLFLDDDVVPATELVTEHLCVHAAQPNAVVIGPMSPPSDGRRPAWIRWEEEKLVRQYRAMIRGDWECSARQFYTGNASLRRALFLAAGGFDPGYRRAEDVELAYRLQEFGVRFVFRPEAEALHYPSRTLASWRRTPRQYGSYDVSMQRAGGQETLDNAAREFHSRHPLSRALARLCVGRAPLLGAALVTLEAAARAADLVDGAGPVSSVGYPIASAGLSAMFHLLYWQGACDALGGRGALWRTVDAARPASTSAAPVVSLAVGGA